MQRSRFFVIATCIILGLSSLCAKAQFSSGVTGTVVDSSGAAISGATITVTDSRLGVSRSTTSSDAGVFRIDSIAASTYTVEVKQASFKTWTEHSLVLQVGEVRTISPVLQIGEVSSTVSVSAELAALDTTSATTGAVISEVTMEETPLVGQNIFTLAGLSPGVMGVPVTSGDNFSNQYDVHLSAAGQRQENNSFILDGAHVDTDSRGGETPVSPNPEIIESLQANANQYDAEKGRNSGMNIIEFTKSGTNKIHGTVDYMFTNNNLSALNEFESAVPVFSRNEAGATIGGPIIKNKLFGFGSIDVLRSSSATAYPATVETQQLLTYVEASLPNNIATEILKMAPPQSYPTTGILTAAQVQAANPGYPGYNSIAAIPGDTPVLGTINVNYSLPRNGNEWNSRVDQYLGNKDRIYYEFNRMSVSSLSTTARPGLNFPTPNSTDFGNTNWTHIFSPHLLNEIGFDMTRALGENDAVPDLAIPTINVTGTTGVGGWGPGNYIENSVGGREMLSLSIKSHDLKFGGNMEVNTQFGDQSGAYNRPSFNFDNILDFIQDEAVSEGATPINLQTDKAAGAVFNSRNNNSGVFAQDDWKVTRRLTVDLGLRYDNYGHLIDIYAAKLTDFALGSGTGFNQQVANGVQGLAKSPQVSPNVLWEFEPRVGFSWDVFGTGKTALRGGFGLFSDKVPYLAIYNGLVTNLPIFYAQSFNVLSGSPTPTLALCDPPQAFGMNCPISVPTNISFDSHGGIVGQRATIGSYSPNLKNGEVDNWSLSIQHQLRSNLVLELNYSASAGHHLVVQTDVNRFAGDLIQNNGTLTRLNPSFGTINYVTTDGNSIGNFGSAVLTRRSSRGLALRGIYTWGKAMDAISTSGSTNSGSTPNGEQWTSVIQSGNLRAQRSRSDTDVRQQLSIDGVWSVPGPRQTLLERQVLGGWTLGGIGAFQTGEPVTVYTTAAFEPVFDSNNNLIGNAGGDYNGDGYNWDIPNAPSFGRHMSGQSKKQFLNGIFAASDFPAPSLGQEGNLGRNTYNAPGYANVNMNIEKAFSIPWLGGERMNLECRGEVYDLLNRANLMNLDSNMADALFGHATGQQPSRSLQFHVRAQF